MSAVPTDPKAQVLVENFLAGSTATGGEARSNELSPAATNATIPTSERYCKWSDTREMAQSSDGQFLAFCADNGIKLLSLSNSFQALLTDTPPDRVHIAFGPTGKVAVSDGQSYTRPIIPITHVHIYGTADVFVSDRPNPLGELPQHALGRIAFSPNGKWLMVGDNVEYSLWDTTHWRTNYVIEKPFKGDQGIMSFSPDNSVVAMTMDRDLVMLADSLSGQELATIHSLEGRAVSGMAFSPDGHRLAMACTSGQIQVLDVRLIRQGLASMNLDWKAAASLPNK